MEVIEGAEKSEPLWDSVHMCPKCGCTTKVSEIDLKAIATGVIECGRCGWAGPINVQIVEAPVGTR
jgi:transcription elongation factor Elf1